MVIVLFPFAAHAMQTMLCLFLTYCFGRKSQHPRYDVIAVSGIFGWVFYLAMSHHQARAIRRRANRDAVEMEGNRNLRNTFSTPNRSIAIEFSQLLGLRRPAEGQNGRADTGQGDDGEARGAVGGVAAAADDDQFAMTTSRLQITEEE